MPSKADKATRGRRPAAEDERKDRVIQTRVPKDLESTLKEAAEQKRMTVSHLIRNVLEDTFNLVDGIVADSSALVEHVTRDARRLAATARGEASDKPLTPAKQGGTLASQLLDSVDAWQDVIVNKPDQCIECGKELARGERAFRGLTTAPGIPAVWLCSHCISTL
ncbi:MAG: hypothetical protein V2I38_07675 [Alcanivoracaceae bacterium]|nr:hypothetical protein [Alcanivoracaceae bacterium]